MIFLDGVYLPEEGTKPVFRQAATAQDYVKYAGDRTPRSAIEDIAACWRDISQILTTGAQHPDFVVGDPANAPQLTQILAARADFLFKAAADDANWE